MTRPVAPRVAGVAGGVGTSTIARWLRATDVGVYAGGPVEVLVCRPTAAATLRAVAAVGQGTTPAGARPVLVVVEDGWAVPAPARARLRMVSPAVAGIVHVPYVPAWRLLDDPLGPAAPPPPRRVRAAVVELVMAVEREWAAAMRVGGTR